MKACAASQRITNADDQQVPFIVGNQEQTAAGNAQSTIKH